MRGWMMVSAALALSASPLAAQETRVAPEDHVPPPASLEQVDWLVGQWVGTGIGGAPAMESWLPPRGNTMVGTFVQETAEGGIRFTEHLYLMEEEGTLVLRLKHFNADLTGWEEKDGMLTFRLIAVEDCAAYFHALTLRCDGDDGLLAAVRMQSGEELVFRFDALGSEHPQRCPDAVSASEMYQCNADVLDRADGKREYYLATAIDMHADQPELAKRIKDSDAAFLAYRDTECGAAHEDWEEGTMRGVKGLGCRIVLTDLRTENIWRNWLANIYATIPPNLPEPKPTL